MLELKARKTPVALVLTGPDGTSVSLLFSIRCNCVPHVLTYAAYSHVHQAQAYVSITPATIQGAAEAFVVHATVFRDGRARVYTSTTQVHNSQSLYIARTEVVGMPAKQWRPTPLPVRKATAQRRARDPAPARAPRVTRGRESRTDGRRQRNRQEWASRGSLRECEWLRGRDWSDGGELIELLVGYTRNTWWKAESNLANIRAATGSGVCIMNDALHASGIETQVCVTDWFPLKVVEPNNLADPYYDKTLLARVSSLAWPAGRALRRKRHRSKADVVTVLVARNKQADLGEAYIWHKQCDDFTESAFSITSWLKLEFGVALAHEVAHNFGCQHLAGGYDYIDAHAKSHTFEYDYVLNGEPETDWICTILTNPESGGTCHRTVRLYSTPDVRWPSSTGTPAGIAGDRDNARTIRKRLRIFANWGNNLRPVP